jgi:6-phosphogluconolactonase (cycloisomerase 2 family)
MAIDPSGSYLYVTDSASAGILGYSVGSGTLTPLNGSPFPAGNAPSAIAIDTTGKFAYVANAADANVTAYTISGGALTSFATYAAGLQPVAIGIDPSLNQYVYTANFLGSNVSGFELSAKDGSLLNAQNSPFPSNAQPTAIAAIPHGSQKK